MREDCLRIGLTPGDIVMVHASLRAVGPILGGPDVLIDAILNTIGTSGTMMVYVGCQLPFDAIGRGMYSPAEEALIVQHCPPFNPDVARADREFGSLAELFRTRDGVRCSAQVGSRMAACGARAQSVLQTSGLDYPLGKNSPLEHLYEAGGKVLLIGSDPDHVTLLHYAEAIAPVENKRTLHIRVPWLVNGRREWIDVTEFDSSRGIRDWRDRFFAHVVTRFIADERATSGTIGNATSYLIGARELVDFAVPMMVQEANRYFSSPLN